MSAPSIAERDSEYLKYGFLSIKAGNAIRSKLDGDPLSEDELEILHHADQLLRQISTGAELVTSGSIQNNDIDPVASMKALDVAKDPIKHIQGQVKLHQLAQLFASMADTLKACSGSDRAPSKEQKQVLAQVASFFDALYQYVATTLDRRGNIPSAPQTGDVA
jgi:hypothetical protein